MNMMLKGVCVLLGALVIAGAQSVHAEKAVRVPRQPYELCFADSLNESNAPGGIESGWEIDNRAGRPRTELGSSGVLSGCIISGSGLSSGSIGRCISGRCLSLGCSRCTAACYNSGKCEGEDKCGNFLKIFHSDRFLSYLKKFIIFRVLFQCSGNIAAFARI